ncbi:MAG: Y-family DNA polymerase [Rickettsiales bacterium]|nr:Y-family DNA polymerase [Rickettsiales bacterium]
MYALIDNNNFYASCERVFDPSLKHKPVLILSSNDGCIIARSNEAKALGIKMGEPFYKYRELAKQNQVAIFSSNFTLYGDMSGRVRATLATLLYDVEVYSIDEIFSDVSGYEDKQALGEQVRDTVVKWTGIPVTVGIAPTKTLAKAAVSIAKKHKGYHGVFYLDSDERRIKLLKHMEIDDIWGIGRQWGKKLRQQGIHKAYDLTEKPNSWIRKHMNVIGLRVADELRGIPCFHAEEQPEAKKSITVSRSFGSKITSFDELAEALSYFASRSAEKLRKEQRLVKYVSVYVRTNYFNKNEPQYRQSKTIELPFYSDYTPDILNAATKALESIFQEGYNYKKCGILLTDLIDSNQYCDDLFNEGNKDANHKLMEAIDGLNQKMGSSTVSYATTLGQGQWKPNSNLKSKSYTTKWDELVEI